MNEPFVASQPRMFGGHLESIRLPWHWAEDRLTRARTYWIHTTRDDGRPHARPIWAVWLDGRCFFSTGSLAAHHLLKRSAVTVSVELGDDVVIIEGEAVAVSERARVVEIVAAYNDKYAWNLDVDALPGPFYEVRAGVVFGWVSDNSGVDGGAAFQGTATKWRPGPPTS